MQFLIVQRVQQAGWHEGHIGGTLFFNAFRFDLCQLVRFIGIGNDCDLGFCFLPNDTTENGAIIENKNL